MSSVVVQRNFFVFQTSYAMTQPMDSSDAPAVPVDATEGWVAINLARAASPAALKSLERRLTQVSVLLSASASNTARGKQVSSG